MKDNLNICARFTIGPDAFVYTFQNNWGNRTFNCSFSAKTISLCFDDFQHTDEGLFSLHSSAITDDTSLKNTTLKQASKIYYRMCVSSQYRRHENEISLSIIIHSSWPTEN